MELAKDIVIAMLQYGYIFKSDNNDTNIEIIKKAYQEIYNQIKSR